MSLLENPPTSRGSLRARAFNDYVTLASRPMMAVLGRGAVAAPSLLTAARPGVNRGLSAVSPVPRGTRISPVREWSGTGRVYGEWVHEHPAFGGRIPDPATGRKVIYYLHGSGYVICSSRTHRGLVARLGRRAGVGSFSVDYRLGPEYQWPLGGDDAIRGYRWLLNQGFDGSQIVVAGDSAGGHLALDLLAANHRDGLPQPSAMVLFSPLYDPSFQMACALEDSGVKDPIINAHAARHFLRMYTGDADPDDPRMRVQLSPDMDLPRTLIQVGAREVMADDARAIHRVITEAGGTSTLQEWPGQGHVFQMFPYFTPESRHAVHEAASFIADA
ncbi:alpha/beta hydrolase [Gordonia sp. PDNC005]|uniref:alpha/beta hydrolase n=1 Tax=unclassified Gordonia (in: high G+C Gram-positive bacteria) TaxID=2657482 RepID=UPI001965703B|nr:alpha/beta hydrolase [Gordonia sp. PDNC005]QRY62415.1 alpha/beta hydrolase [Gordonia sp. PDNC005]